MIKTLPATVTLPRAALISQPHLMKALGVAQRKTIIRWTRTSDLPSPVRVGPKRNFYWISDVLDWCQAKSIVVNWTAP